MLNLSLPKIVLGCAAFVGAASLVGCGSSALYPDAAVNAPAPTETPVGSIRGSNYGGHAPIVGSHIYLLQPGNTGYGSLTKGLLTSGYQGSYSTQDTFGDQFVPAVDSAGNPYYYETTDSTGSFNLTGDYTCTVGQPVYIVGYGGDPSYQNGGPNVFNLSAADTVYSDGTHALFTYTVTSPLPELFYIGENVAVTQFSGGSTGFNVSGVVADPGSASQTVTTGGTTYKPTLSTTQFSIYLPTTLAAGSYTPLNGTAASAIATGTPHFNPAAVNIAMLGLCPSSGNFSTGASALQYVYMNEISTTAFAYAMNQYANWSANDQTGNDEFHIGAPNTAQAQVGIQNAALMAGNLYDIQGRTGVSTTFAGEGHLARTVTASGAGIVPQQTLDTVGNILAACVDSENTYRLGTGTQSPQCKTLNQYAQDNGVYDTTATTHFAFNIAQAAMNIAHYPQGAGTGTTTGQNGSGYGGTQTVTPGNASSAAAFTNALFNLPTGNVPFTPNLASAPNDFAVGINWQTSPYAQSGTGTGSTTNQTTVSEVAIDSLGNAWIVANSNGSSNTNYNGVFKLAPTGFYTTYSGVPNTAVGTTTNAGIAIDTFNNLFISSTAGVQKLTAANSYKPNGANPGSNIIGYINGNYYNYYQNVTANAGELAIDNGATPSIYVANINQTNPPATSYGTTQTKLVKEPAVVGNTTATFTVSANGLASTANTATACTSFMAFLTLDANNNIWTTNAAYEYGGLGGQPDQICKFSNSGAFLYSYQAASQNGRMIAVDAAGNAWWPNYVANTLMEASATATSASGTNGVATTYTYPSGILPGPWAIAVDGADTIWVASRSGGSTITHISDAGALLSPTSYTGMTTAGGFNTVTGSGTTMPEPSFAVIDQSGNLWTADAPHGEVLEWVGVAAPTVQPLVQQRVNSVAGNGHGIGQMP